MKSHRNVSQQTHPIHPHWILNLCVGAFLSVWVHLGPFRYCMKLDAKRAVWCNYCKSSCHEVASEFFATNAPDPPHLTVNWRFGMFCTIWVHLVPFGCLTKLCGKRGELVQKFVPLDPKLTLWFISYHLGAFGTVCLPYKMGWTSAKVRATKSCWNFSQRTHPIHPIGP